MTQYGEDHPIGYWESGWGCVLQRTLRTLRRMQTLNRDTATVWKCTVMVFLNWRTQKNCPPTLSLLSTSPGDSEEALAASALDSNLQHAAAAAAAVVQDGGQRVITIVTDQHGNLQTSGGGQPFFLTMQHGQQSEEGATSRGMEGQRKSGCDVIT